MHELILHHYPTSPFAEKGRLLLGFKQLSWRSVMIPPVMPKPDLTALTGGYRKTPVLQIGADIYCDTALIARRLEAEKSVPACVSSRHLRRSSQSRFAYQSSSLGGRSASATARPSRASIRRVQRTTTTRP